MANLKEVSKAVKILKMYNCKKISLLHCVSSYPAKINSCNLNSTDFLRKKLQGKKVDETKLSKRELQFLRERFGI